MEKQKKRGISLIVLVITIIVIVVLSVAVILTIAQNNPIESARKAVFVNDLKTIQEEISLYIADMYADNLGNTTNLSISGDDMVELFPSTEKYKDKIMIINGEVRLTENLTAEEKTWASEVNISNEAVLAWNGSVDTSWYNAENTEFNIYTAEEFAGISKLASTGTTFEGKTVNLMNDIDLDNVEWTPIADFKGTFNGNKKQVEALNIVGEINVESGDNTFGLFAKNSGTITDITVYGYNVELKTTSTENTGADLGILVGENTGNILNSSVQNSGYNFDISIVHETEIDIGVSFGMLVGENSGGNITNCNSLDTPCIVIENTNESYKPASNIDYGAIVGYLNVGNVTKCHSSGTAEIALLGDFQSFNRYCGGICGYAQSGAIDNCYASFYINDIDTTQGGIAGLSTATISNCLVELDRGSNILTEYRGGIIGEGGGSFTNCIVAGWDIDMDFSEIGAFSGDSLSNGSNNYAIGNFELLSAKDNDVEGYTIITDKETAKKKETYSDQLWESGLWDIEEGETYPYLKHFNVKLK